MFIILLLGYTGRKHNDPDAMAMAAESFMNLSPWDYYLQVWLSACPSCLASQTVCRTRMQTRSVRNV